MQERGSALRGKTPRRLRLIVSMLAAFASAEMKTVHLPGAQASRPLFQHSPWIGMDDTDEVRRFKLTYLRASA